MGTNKQFNIFIEKSFFQPPTIKKIGEEIKTYLKNLNQDKLCFNMLRDLIIIIYLFPYFNYRKNNFFLNLKCFKAFCFVK